MNTPTRYQVIGQYSGVNCDTTSREEAVKVYEHLLFSDTEPRGEDVTLYEGGAIIRAFCFETGKDETAPKHDEYCVCDVCWNKRKAIVDADKRTTLLSSPPISAEEAPLTDEDRAEGEQQAAVEYAYRLECEAEYYEAMEGRY